MIRTPAGKGREGVTDTELVADRLVSSQEGGGANSDRANCLRIL